MAFFTKATPPVRLKARLMIAGLSLGLAGACVDGLDYDMRGTFGSELDTSTAAQTATAERPRADKRGIISYPNYQVAVARRGDTLNDVALRIDMPVSDLASYNGIRAEDSLRKGEIIALPYRVAEPSAATGGTGIVTAPDVDIASLAGNAIGLGNFLRFPVQAAQNGGGAFMIPYVVAFLVLGLPIAPVSAQILRDVLVNAYQNNPRIATERARLRSTDELVNQAAKIRYMFGGQARVPLVVRLEGTNVERGKQIINDSDLDVIAADDLDDAAQKIVKAVQG